MKTLRLLRNIAVLFILVMALLASRPVTARAGRDACGYKKGSAYCLFDPVTGFCADDVPCSSFIVSGSCPNIGCTNKKPF